MTGRVVPLRPGVPGPPQGAEGATLVELLVGLCLLGLLAGLLLGGMRLGLSVWESGGERQAFEERLERTDGFLRQLLGQAALAPAAAIAAAGDAGFLGGPQELRFRAPLPYQLGGGGHYLFDLGRLDGEDLVLAWRRTGAEEGSSGRTALLDHLQSLHLAYFGRPSSASPPAWQESWSGRAGLPALVRLDLAFAPDRPPRRLSLYFALRLSGNGS